MKINERNNIGTILCCVQYAAQEVSLTIKVSLQMPSRLVRSFNGSVQIEAFVNDPSSTDPELWRSLDVFVYVVIVDIVTVLELLIIFKQVCNAGVVRFK